MSIVKIYTTDYCGYCTAAKELLKQLGVAFEEIDVSNDPTMREQLVALTHRRTVPQIFIRGQAIGGFTDLRALRVSGKLAEMLEGET